MNYSLNLQEFSDIVNSVEQVTFSGTGHVSILRAKLILVDASELRIKEVTHRDKLIAYSYYWLHSDNSIIIGWDNAPHHKEISSFPHHRHIGNKVEKSSQTNLKEVLYFIREILS